MLMKWDKYLCFVWKFPQHKQLAVDLPMFFNIRRRRRALQESHDYKYVKLNGCNIALTSFLTLQRSQLSFKESLTIKIWFL